MEHASYICHMLQGFTSKLPRVGNTIFSTMSALALEHQAINLGQGFADYSMNHKLCNLVHTHMLADKNQYAPMPGVPELRQAISEKLQHLYNYTCSWQQQITITPGGTYGIYNALCTVVQPGDEVIVLEPAYDSYVPNIELCGGIPVLVALETPSFTPNWTRIQNAITNRTKAIIVNTPHNPGGYCFTTEDWQQLYNIVHDKNIYVISDEVYEHIVLDGKAHYSILAQPQLAAHAFAVFSFGKVYHNTGWKLGYVVANEALSTEFRKIHQYLAFACNTPVQYALADFLADKNEYSGLPAFFEQKRNMLLDGLASSKFIVHAPAQGSFFQTIDYSAISQEADIQFCERLVSDYKIAAIPVSAFYQNAKDDKLIRLCFAKKEETLNAAIEKLLAVK
jgi:methionine transaminase